MGRAQRRKNETKPDSEQLRARLLARYKEAFGCEWDATPWGKRRWRSILIGANAADRDWDIAVAALRKLVAAVDDVVAIVQRHGADPSATRGDLSDALGMTWPEAVALGLVRDLDLVSVGSLIRAALGLFPNALPANSDRELPRLTGELLKTSRKAAFGPLDLALAREGVPDFEPGTSRRWQSAVVFARGSRRELVGPAAPVGLEPPPRVVQGPEWRRAYLVQLLDILPIRPGSLPGSKVPVEDADIAVVSLLAGGLDELVRERGGKIGTFSTVLAKERNAVAHARKRRTTLSKLANSPGHDLDAVLRWMSPSARADAGTQELMSKLVRNLADALPLDQFAKFMTGRSAQLDSAAQEKIVKVLRMEQFATLLESPEGTGTKPSTSEASTTTAGAKSQTAARRH